MGQVGFRGQSRWSSFISANAKTILHAGRKQPFLDKIEKNSQLFHILPRSSGFFLVLLSSNDDSTRQVIITLSEMLQAASCSYFSPFFNNHSSPCCLPKPPIAGTAPASWQDSLGRRKALLMSAPALPKRKWHWVTGPCQPGMTGRLLAFLSRTRSVNMCLKLLKAHRSKKALQQLSPSRRTT